MPLRIAHIADTHLGYRALFRSDPATGRNQRAVDIERAYEIVVGDILTREVQLVVHAGDVFHHTRPTWAAIRAFVKQTRRLTDAGIPVVVIGGNHDTPRLRTSGSVFSVLELALPGVEFVCGYDQLPLPFDDLRLNVLAIPHGKLADPSGPSAMPAPGRRNILVTHGLVSGLQLKGSQREPGEEDVPDFLLDREFDYIALGHYHVHGHAPTSSAFAWYSGSTERMGFGDEDVMPGYALVELGQPGAAPEVTHIPIEARPMKTLAPIDGEGRTARDIADLVRERVERDCEPDAMVRVELRNTQRSVRREAESILKREGHPGCWSLQVFSRGDILLAPGERRVEGASTDVRVLFDEFLVERAYEPAFGDAFAVRGRRALDEAGRALESAGIEDGAA